MIETMENEVEQATAMLGPGIYPGLSSADYHSLDCASASRLNKLGRSPLHCKYSIDHPGEQTAAMALGSAVHSAILEPREFACRYVVAPKVDKRTTAGKAAYAEFCAGNQDKDFIDADDYALCSAMSAAVWAHPAAGPLLKGVTDIELSAVWRDTVTGLLCKLRADGITMIGDEPAVIDLKTTEDASRKSFERSILNFGYHRQAAHYLNGLARNDRPIEHFCLIAVEKSPPHAVAVYRVRDDVLSVGDDEVRRLLKLYAACVAEPELWGRGYGDEIQDIAMPQWALSEASRDE